MTDQEADAALFDDYEVLRVAAQAPPAVLSSEAALVQSLSAICEVPDPIREQNQSLTDLNHLALAAPLARLLQGYGPGVRDILMTRGKGARNARLAALLTLMMPDSGDAAALRRLGARGVDLGWLGAVAGGQGDRPQLMALLARARQKLLDLEVPGADLRLPTDVPAEALEAFQDEMRRIYRADGPDKARAFLEQTRADRSTALGRLLSQRRP